MTNNVPHTTVTTETYNADAKSWDIAITADSGYKIKSVSCRYYGSTGFYHTTTFTISEDGKTASKTITYNVDQYTKFTLTGTVEESGDVPTVTNNIANSTASYTGENPFSLTVAAADGYKFETSPTATYTNAEGEAQTDTFLLSSDCKTATLTTATVSSSNLVITLEGTTVPEKVEPTITNNIANSTASYTGSEHQYVITVNTTYGYIFSGEITATYTGYSSDNPVSVTLAVSSDKKTASGVCPDVDENTPIVLAGATEKEATGTTTVTTSLTNCAVVGTLPETIAAGETLTVTLQANENTHFETAPLFRWLDSKGYYNTQEMTIAADTRTASGTFVNPDTAAATLTIVGTATPDTVIGDNYGAINVYKVTLDALDAFSKKRFFTEATNPDGTEYTLINLGNYVNRLKRLFFNVTTASADVIKCGNYNTGVECEAPDTDTVTLNFGSITIPTPNGDSTDYQSELQLFVPFRGMVTLPVDYIGKTITLTYTVNVITGGGVAKVLCGDDVILLLDVEPNEDILYQTNLDNLATIGGDEWNEHYLYGIEPYIRVKYYNSLNKTTRNNDYKNAKLSDLSGYCVMDDVALNTSAEMTADEQETIIALLKNGVYIEQ